jgi:futalosine hydrolase
LQRIFEVEQRGRLCYTHQSTVAMKKNKTLGMIAAVPLEGDIIARNLEGAREKSAGGLTWHTGRLGRHEIVCVVSGIGKTNAAHAATVLIQNFSPCLAVNFGIGGAYPSSGLALGDIAVASKEVYADEGVLLKSGFRTLELVDIPLLKAGRRRYFNEFPIDSGLSVKMMEAATAAGFRARRGTFATVSTCTGTRKRAEELSKRFGAICENMEGAAVAHICVIYSIPCVEVRGISNIVKERDISKWDIRPASVNCQKTVIEFACAIEL